ncbi:MAG: alanyl-tRNA editing protein [Proteobacteria bacterium]|nr:alanyl-tRNA editing protein [Pseudomonadota bacterium]
MTLCLYFDDTSCLTCDATVIAHVPLGAGTAIILDQTLFHPQGGGQPADKGFISWDGERAALTHIRLEGETILHEMRASDPVPPIGTPITCHVDGPWRSLCARTHTAAHLMAHVVESLAPGARPVRAHAFPGEAYVTFEGDMSAFDQARFEGALDGATTQNLAIEAFTDGGVRHVKIGDFPPTPCGGTHVSRTGDIGKVRLTRVKLKQDRMSLFFEVT